MVSVRLEKDFVSHESNCFLPAHGTHAGLADPRPIVQTFFNDYELVQKVRLDGVVCVVDSMFVEKHLDEKGGQHGTDNEVNEAKQQICYADRIIMNKVDLVPESAKLQALQARIKELNPMAALQRTQFGEVDVSWALGVGGFDLETVAGQLESEMKVDDEDRHHHHHHDHHHHHHHDHHHDDEVGSVSLILPGNLDLEKVNLWLETLLMLRQEDIYRMKGVLSIEGWDQRFVFQGIHHLFSGVGELDSSG